MPNLIERVQQNGWRQTAVEIVGGQWYKDKTERTAYIIDMAYQKGPALVPTRELARHLAELDPRLYDLVKRMEGWNILSGASWGTRLQFTEQDRIRAIWESRFYYHYDVQIANSVDMWTDFGFGQSVKISPSSPVDEDEDTTDDTTTPLDAEKVDPAAEVWDKFWDNPRNGPVLKQRKLAQFSNETVRDGEMFFEFSASGQDGSTTIRRVYTEEIAEVIYETDDQDVPLFYKRKVDKGYLYYPDWQAKQSYADVLDATWEQLKKDGKIPSDAQRADQASETQEFSVNGEQQERRLTDVVMQQVALNEINGRGWPQLRRAIEWANALKNFLQDRATVARMVAAYVDEITVDHGSRGIDAVKANLGTTLNTGLYTERKPPAPAGSTLTHNKAVDVKRRPLTTGAGDAVDDAMLMVGQISAASKVPPHWQGFPMAMQNRATARESSRPFMEQMERYQTFWTSVFKEWVTIVLWFDTQYGSGADHSEVEVTVTLESPLDLEMEEVTKLMDSITAAHEKGLIPDWMAEVATQKLVVLGLEDLGVRDFEQIEEPDWAKEDEDQDDDSDDDDQGDGQQPPMPPFPFQQPDQLPGQEPGQQLGPTEGTGALARVEQIMTLNSMRQSLDYLAMQVDAYETMLEGGP